MIGARRVVTAAWPTGWWLLGTLIHILFTRRAPEASRANTAERAGQVLTDPSATEARALDAFVHICRGKEPPYAPAFYSLPPDLQHSDFPLSITLSPALCTPSSLTRPPSHHSATLSLIILTLQTPPLYLFNPCCKLPVGLLELCLSSHHQCGPLSTLSPIADISTLHDSVVLFPATVAAAIRPHVWFSEPGLCPPSVSLIAQSLQPSSLPLCPSPPQPLPHGPFQSFTLAACSVGRSLVPSRAHAQEAAWRVLTAPAVTGRRHAVALVHVCGHKPGGWYWGRHSSLCSPTPRSLREASWVGAEPN